MTTADSTVIDTSSRLRSAMSELVGLQGLLDRDDLDPRILRDFRDALNRVRNAAWAAQQYAESKATGNDSGNILSLVAGERIRAAYQLCQSIADDLESPDVGFQPGQLIELYNATKSLTEKLGVIVHDLE